MLDPTLTAPISGTVAANLRGTVTDLVQDVGDVQRRLSVVETQDTLAEANKYTDQREKVITEELKTVKQSVSDGKGKVARAITDKGVSTDPSAPFQTMADKIGKIKVGDDTSGATAAASEIIAGKTAYVKGAKVAGTMPNRGAQVIAASGTTDVVIPDGCHTGSKVARVNVPADHLLNNANIAGVQGTMPHRSNENVHLPSLAHTVWPGDRAFMQPPHGFYNGGTWVTAPTPHLRPENIRAGVDVLGMVGTLNEGVRMMKGTVNTVRDDRAHQEEYRIYVEVRGLAFKPNLVAISTGSLTRLYGNWDVYRGATGLSWAVANSGGVDDGYKWILYNDGFRAYTSGTGEYHWVAFS